MARQMLPKVKPEYRDFLPERTAEERKLLRESIIEDGIRDPIVITEDGYIVDGHGRWEFAQEFKLKVKTFVKEFADEEAKYAWMAKNQAGKRNLTKEQKDYYMGVRAAKAILEHGGDRRSSDHADNLRTETAESIAKEENVSVITVRRNVEYAAGIIALPPKVQKEVLAGKTDIPKKEIIANAPVMCGRCRRLGAKPLPGCVKCEEAQAEHKKKKFGPKPKKPKSGSMKYDWATFETNFGRVARAADEIVKGYGEPKGPGTDHQNAHDLIHAYFEHMNAWRKRLTGVKS